MSLLVWVSTSSVVLLIGSNIDGAFQGKTEEAAPNWGTLSTESLLLLRHDIELLKSRGRREFAMMVGLQFHHLQHDLKPQIQTALEDTTSVPMDDFGKEVPPEIHHQSGLWWLKRIHKDSQPLLETDQWCS